MSYTKRFIQKVSIEMGYGGKINDHVIRKASEALADATDSVHNLTELYNTLRTEHNNDDTQNGDGSLDKGTTSKR